MFHDFLVSRWKELLYCIREGAQATKEQRRVTLALRSEIEFYRKYQLSAHLVRFKQTADMSKMQNYIAEAERKLPDANGVHEFASIC